jgi:putative membrane protein
MRIRTLTAAATVGLGFALGVGPVRPLYAQGNPADINLDIDFIRQAASDNMFEVRGGGLAEKQAANPAVKQFGQQMVTDHTKLNNDLSAVVSPGRPFLPGMSREQEQEFDQLKKLSGAEFDRAYMSAMIQGHQKAVSSFQTQAQTAHSTQVRQLVIAALPTLQQHLTLAQQVGSQVGAGPSVAVTPTNPPVSQNPPVQNPPVVTQNPPAPAQNPTAANQNPQAQATAHVQAKVKADAEFIRDAVADNFLEVHLGQLAEKKARNSAVKEFGQRMVTDHTTMQTGWVQMAHQNGMPIKPGMGPRHREKLTRLEKMSGKKFDRAFMTLMIQQHQDEVEYFSKEGRAANSAPVRSLVTTGLPILQQHLSLAKQIGNRVGVDTVAVLRNRDFSVRNSVRK